MSAAATSAENSMNTRDKTVGYFGLDGCRALRRPWRLLGRRACRRYCCAFCGYGFRSIDKVCDNILPAANRRTRGYYLGPDHSVGQRNFNSIADVGHLIPQFER